MPLHPETEANREPNRQLIKARGRLSSPFHPGRRMSRAELADAVNAALRELYPELRNVDSHDVDGRWIGNLERGERHWASPERRAALRRVTGAETDQQLGLHRPRHAERGVSAEILADGSETVDPASMREEAAAASGTTSAALRPESDGVVTPAGGLLAAVQAIGSREFTLDDLDRFAAVTRDARRYLDAAVVKFLSDRLDQSAEDDGLHGPRYALPAVLGVASVVEHAARTAQRHVRRPLLGVGARAAELAGWLYRDCGRSVAADYWRDRATEWAMESSDFAMPGYVLIKKSQSAWDDRDAGRMLGLAEAVQDGPWDLPAKVMAEAVQQQARGFAMLNTSRRQVDDTLKRARELLALDSGDSSQLGAHYDSALFKVQTAICYGESGRPDQAAEIYEAALTPTVFSARDFAYFSTLQAQVLVADHRPDDAAKTGTAALSGAVAAGSARTVRELSRLRDRLLPWRERAVVQSFIRLMDTV